MPSTQRKVKSRKLAPAAAFVRVGTLAFVLLAVLGGTQANAALRTWGNTGTNFATGANWVGGTAPANNITADVGLFTNGTVTNNPVFTADRSINGLRFNTGTAAWTFTGSGGTQTLTLGSGGITNSSTNTQTFSASGLQLALGANAVFNPNNGALAIDSAVNLSNRTLILQGSGTSSTISGVVSGTGNITKTNTGTWTLNNANTFTGDTRIVLGVLSLGNANALSGSTVLIESLGILRFGSLTNANLGGLGGSISLGSPGNIALTNDSGGNVALNVGGNNQSTLYNGEFSGGGSLTKVGTGTLTLYGENSYTGGTTINEGSVAVNNGLAFGSGTVTLASNGATVIGIGGVTPNNYVLNADATFYSPGNFWLNSGVISGAGSLNIGQLGGDGGEVSLSGTNTYTGTTTINDGILYLSGGSAIVDTGTVILADGNAVIYTESSETIGSLRGGGTNGGFVELGNGSTLTVAETGSQTFAGFIGNDGSLAKTGTGTLTLSGSNSFTGAVGVQGGTLGLAATGGNSALGGASAVSVGAGATLLISQSNQINNAAGITLSGGTIAKGSGVITETVGALSLTADSNVDFGAGTGNFTFATYTPGLFDLKFLNFNLGNSLTVTTGTFNTSEFDFNGFGYTWAVAPVGGFTITAVPEPATVLAAIGLAGLFAWPLRRHLRPRGRASRQA
jgi:autotransporter-associated beta strand protein